MIALITTKLVMFLLDELLAEIAAILAANRRGVAAKTSKSMSN